MAWVEGLVWSGGEGHRRGGRGGGEEKGGVRGGAHLPSVGFTLKLAAVVSEKWKGISCLFVSLTIFSL